MSPTTTHKVTLIGLGAMGSALATALVKPLANSSDTVSKSNNINLTLYNRTPTRPIISTLTSQGAILAPSLPAALSTPSDVIVLCLISYAAVDDLLASLPSSSNCLEGKTILNLTNGTPSQARRMSEKLKTPVAHGGWGVKVYLDGAVMATPAMVGGPGSQIFASGSGGAGERESWEGMKGWLVAERWGEPCWFGGGGGGEGNEADVGAASTQDLANLAAMYGLFEGALIAMALIKKSAANSNQKQQQQQQQQSPAVLPAVEKYIAPLMANMVPLLSHIASEWDDGVEEGGPHPLGMQLVVLDNIVRACDEEGVAVDGLKGLRERMRRVVEKEDGTGGGEVGMTPVARRYLL